jgi:phosphoglucosamine mutase
MEKKLFGTDGIRGKANQYPIVPELLIKVAQSVAHFFTRGNHRHTIVIGKDTRQSGYMIESALTSGFTAMGMDVILVGPIPTPAVSILTRSMRADLGVMISASHNPYEDNGIKFFNAEGAKLTDWQERELESLILGRIPLLTSHHHVGMVRRLDAQGRYIEYAKSTLPRGFSLNALKIVIDCAHGAAYKVAPQVLWELGAEVVPIGAQPDGTNINDHCGATSPQKLCDAVLEHQADLGIALDGDADRLIMVDEKGYIIDGDNLMGLIARSWQEDGKLRGGAVVATLMSNLGLERYLKGIGLDLVRTNVGDRYVLEKMQEHHYNFGGEQSGHLILTDYSATGDGLVAALQVLKVFMESREQNPQKKFSEIARVFTPIPQILSNVRVSNKLILNQNLVRLSIQRAEQSLKDLNGRILVRPSGTEPLIRIMAEADDPKRLKDIIFDVESALLQENTGIQSD